MKKIFVFLLILLIFSTPCYARKVRALSDQIDALQDLFKGEEVEMSGYVWYVDSGQSHSGDGKTWNGAFITLQEAIGFCEDDRGDTIYVAPGHAYSIISDGLIDLNKRGVSVKGMGNGDNRPTFTVSTATDADMHISANDCTINNLVFINGIDELVDLLTIAADDTTISNCEFRDGSATSGFGAITVGAGDGDSDRLTIRNCTFYQPGSNNDYAIEILKDMTTISIIENYIYGDYDDGAVILTAGANASADVKIIKNTISNVQASGYGITVHDATETGTIADNTVYTDDFQKRISPGPLYVDCIIVAGEDDNTLNYPPSIKDESLWALVLSKSAAAATSSYDNTTDSLEAISVAVADVNTNAEATDIVIDAMQVDIDDMNALGLLQDVVIDAMQVDIDDMNALRIIEYGVVATHLVDINTNAVATDTVIDAMQVDIDDMNALGIAQDVVIDAMQVDIDDMNALGIAQDVVIDAMQVDVDDMNALRIIEYGVVATHLVDINTNAVATDVVIDAMQVDIDDMNALGLLQDVVIDAMQVDIDDMNALRIIEYGVVATHLVDMNTNAVATDTVIDAMQVDVDDMNALGLLQDAVIDAMQVDVDDMNALRIIEYGVVATHLVDINSNAEATDAIIDAMQVDIDDMNALGLLQDIEVDAIVVHVTDINTNLLHVGSDTDDIIVDFTNSGSQFCIVADVNAQDLVNNTQGATSDITTAASGDLYLETIMFQTDSTNIAASAWAVFEISTDNTHGATGVDSPIVTEGVASFTGSITLAEADFDSEELPLLIESGTTIYCHGSNNTGDMDQIIRIMMCFRRIDDAATLTALDIGTIP